MTATARRGTPPRARLPLTLLAAVAAVGLLAAAFSFPAAWEALLRPLFPGEASVLYPTEGLPSLAARHLLMVGVSSLITVAIGVPAGILVTRPAGRDLLPLASAAASLAQTFPPVAVLALAYPALGFGVTPTIVALVLYGVLPVLAGTVAGLRAVDPAAVDAARGMGMTPWQVLRLVELPLAVRPLLAGVRTSVVTNVGTAAIGATIGAGGLGLPIVAGLSSQNLAWVMEGALATALIALTLDGLLAALERALTP
ncbi:MAG TPA: ABC transporter permease [Deinococcales bacterium]|nr:ABC transporter permease [Deinococcales bacterium]